MHSIEPRKIHNIFTFVSVFIGATRQKTGRRVYFPLLFFVHHSQHELKISLQCSNEKRSVPKL